MKKIDIKNLTSVPFKRVSLSSPTPNKEIHRFQRRTQIDDKQQLWWRAKYKLSLVFLKRKSLLHSRFVLYLGTSLLCFFSSFRIVVKQLWQRARNLILLRDTTKKTKIMLSSRVVLCTPLNVSTHITPAGRRR